ncbi:hypothetical protein [Aestuariivirga sp.]|uniref:hypothetical protein n=1 Tax=Aestuariivirga sp. TaxID=2650926 RepID=UPI0039E6355F
MAHVSFISAKKLIELLVAASSREDMHVKVLTTNQLAIGIDPLHPTSVIDLSKELVVPMKKVVEAVPAPRVVESAPAYRHSRQTGRYMLEIKGKGTTCTSLKQILAEGLRGLEAHKSGTLEKLSQIKPRSKRIVAHDPRYLFEQSELVEKYSEKLSNGWWFGTNNSADETTTWLKRGCELAGLTWDRDFVVTI